MLTAARGQRTRQVAAESAWTTRSRQGATSRQHGLPDAEIEHRRVPRGKVGQVLPRLIPGNGRLARVARSAVGDRLMPWHSLRRHRLANDAISALEFHSNSVRSTAIRESPCIVLAGNLAANRVRKTLQLGQLLEQHAADFQNALRMSMHADVIGRHDDLRAQLPHLVEPRAGERDDAVAVADQVLAPAGIRIVTDHVVIRDPRPGAAESNTGSTGESGRANRCSF